MLPYTFRARFSSLKIAPAGFLASAATRALTTNRTVKLFRLQFSGWLLDKRTLKRRENRWARGNRAGSPIKADQNRMFCEADPIRFSYFRVESRTTVRDRWPESIDSNHLLNQIMVINRPLPAKGTNWRPSGRAPGGAWSPAPLQVWAAQAGRRSVARLFVCRGPPPASRRAGPA